MDESKQGQASVVSSVSSARQRDLEWYAYIQAVALGNTDALSSLYDESSHLVYGIALRVLGNQADAEEVTTDVYSQVWRSAANFQEGRGSASGWLVMLARSRAIDRIRSQKRRKKEDPISSAINVESRDESPEQTSSRAQERERIAAAMQSLSPEQRELIVLAFYSGFTQSELAEKLRQPLGTVKTRIRLAMMKLRDLLKEVRQAPPC
jgi:RNA polymerase sigma-70 factor (ECF subfamily)